MIATVVLGLVTGSRKVVVAVLCGTLLFVFVYFKYFPQKKIGKKIAIVSVILVVLGLIIYACFENELLYNIIGNRLEGFVETLTGEGEGEASAEIRYNMIVRAFEMFAQKPLFGWGIEGFAAYSGFWVYSHNNYTETLVSFGIVGFILLYSYKVVLLVAQFKTISREQDKSGCLQSMIIFVAMTISLVLDFAAISMNNLVVNIPFALSAAYLLTRKTEKRRSK